MIAETDTIELQSIQKKLSEALQRGLSETETALLIKHLRFIQEKNKSLNLTSIKNEEEGLLLHVEDSLTAFPEVESALPGMLVDLGSGAGYPGIPLAIITGRKTTLVESTKKKALVLDEFIQAQELEEQINVKAMRIEEFSKIEKKCFAVATARAVSSLSSLMELAAPLLQKGGILVAYKGNISEDELQDAKNIEDLVGMELVGIRKLTLSDMITKRQIIVFKKTSQSKIVLPRKTGQAQNHPLRKLG